MGSKKMIGKTIGEVEKLTGIPKRKLKYMIERDLIHPSQRSASGFWLYSENDIQIARTITLLQQMDYSEKDIRALLSVPASQWSKDLDRQITQLTEKKQHIEDQLFLAEILRYRDRLQTDAAAFSLTGNNIPLVWESEKKDALCLFLYQIFSETNSEILLHELSLLIDRPPDDPVIQEQIQQLCALLWQRSALSPAQLLLILRLARTLSGLIPVLDTLFCTEGAVQFITSALQYHCEHRQKIL